MTITTLSSRELNHDVSNAKKAARKGQSSSLTAANLPMSF